MRTVAHGSCFWDVSESPLGAVHMAVGSRGALLKLSFADSDEGFLSDLKAWGEPVRAPSAVTEVAEQLQDYFLGRRTRFDLDVDLRRMTAFQQEVLQAAQEIPCGSVTTYKRIAERLGRPNASRAVGGALGANPIVIVVPCHRVLASDGTLGGYSGPGGIRSKGFLLEHEGVTEIALRKKNTRLLENKERC